MAIPVGRYGGEPTCRVLAALDLTPARAHQDPHLAGVCAMDVTTPPTLARKLAAGIAAAPIVEFPDGAHCLPIENPTEFVAAIRSCLEIPL